MTATRRTRTAHTHRRRGVSTALKKNSDGTFTAAFLDQTTWSFDSDGKLTAIIDRYGNRSALSYNTSNQLAAISDPAGNGSLSLSYNASTGRLTSVSDWLTPTARTTSFGYDTSNRARASPTTAPAHA